MKERPTKHREFAPTRMARWWWGIVVAVAGTLIAALARWALGWAASDLPTYITFYPVVFVAAIIGGVRPGLLATVLSLLTADLLFMEPVGKLGPATTGQAVGMGLFITINIAISILAGRFRMKSDALRGSEARLQMAHQAAHIGTFEWNMQTGINTWTTELEAMYGLQPGQFGSTESAWEQLVHPEDRARAVGVVNRALETFHPEEGEWRVVRPDGTVHWLVGRAQVFKDSAGKPLRLVGVNFDITDRKQAEEILRESEEHFRTLADAIPQLAWIARADGYIFWYNRRCLEYTGATLEQLEGWGWETVVHPRTLPRVLERWQRSIATGDPYDNLEAQLRGADGRFRPFITRVVPLKDHEGRVKLWFGTATDIAALQEAREALRQSEERFHTMADAIPQLAWIARADGHIFWFNRRTYDYTGATPEQLEGWAWQSFHDPQVLPRVLEQWQQSIATGQPFEMEFPLRGADGRFGTFLTRVTPVKDHAGQVVLWFGTATDITELREREQKLARQARLIDLAPAATLVVRDPDQRIITFWSGGAERLYGWSREEALGRHAWELLRTEFPEPPESILAKLRADGTWSGELRHYTRDGRQVVVQSYWLAEFNANGELEQLLQSNSDITALKQTEAELKRHQEHLADLVEQRTAKLQEAMGELEHMSYSMVHDMRAPLRAMEGFAAMMKAECADCQRQPGLDYLHRIGESSNRLDRLITDALNYNKVVRENVPLTPVDLGRLLRGMVQSYPNLQAPAADITLDLADLTVLGNESLLTQCFGNLLDNAVKFVPQGVKPRIRVWAEPSNLNDQPATAIYIKDNGLGVPKDAQEKIFRMFQRMHSEREYPGTGIGLTIVRKAVERMNGRVSLDSEPGEGTCFRIELPRPTQDTERLQDAA